MFLRAGRCKQAENYTHIVQPPGDTHHAHTAAHIDLLIANWHIIFLLYFSANLRSHCWKHHPPKPTERFGQNIYYWSVYLRNFQCIIFYRHNSACISATILFFSVSLLITRTLTCNSLQSFSSN